MMTKRKDRNVNTRKSFLSERIRKITFPLPEDQQKQGFEPNFYIKFLRRVAKLLIVMLRLNGQNRFSNEFVQMLDPKLKVDLPDGTKMIFRTGHGRLLWRARTFQDEEPLIIDWINQFDSKDCFYDVGANIGTYSLYAARRGIRTFAIEPEFNNLQLLYENIFLNQLQETCTPIPIALGDSTKVEVFHLKSISKGDALHSIGRPSYLLQDASFTYKLDTLVMRLDDLISVFDLPKPTKIKIDVDYNELNVIKGAQKTLDDVQEVYIEIDLKLAEHREVLDLLEKKSFRVVSTESISRMWKPEISNYLFARR